jgi:hypothetical protein
VRCVGLDVVISRVRRAKVPDVEMIAVGMFWSMVMEVNVHVGNML